ncbi:uncharacterized protein LOC127698383 [Mytilus californianus]|uniref:uncharacterized protein LOC127698383 n=1 Tax=Mytilus californianus TaxID=6549 RepID=UPI002246ECC5|nr:uncharacterized protein LOC127698383 [Mytilus californianus]XP_052057789.1 uncharacterized protein LOC127698383 [Mytilus californianus]
MASEDLIPKTAKNGTKSSKSRKCCVWICQITSEAFLEEEDLLHYIGRIESTVSKSAIGAVLLILSYALSIMSLAIGFLRIGTCQCQPVLPIFLIVHGSAMCVRSLFETGKLCKQTKREDASSNACSPLQTLSKISSVLVAFWTITGSVWVFSIVTEVNVNEANNMNYCDPMLYWYSLVLVSVILTGLILKAIFLLVISLVYCRYEDRSWYSELMADNLGAFV